MEFHRNLIVLTIVFKNLAIGGRLRVPPAGNCGEEVVLTCDVGTTPKDPWHWMKIGNPDFATLFAKTLMYNGEQWYGEDGKYTETVRADSFSLTIANMSYTDQGEYMCNHGEEYNTFTNMYADLMFECKAEMADVSATTRGNLVIEIDRIYPADPEFEVRLETSRGERFLLNGTVTKAEQSKMDPSLQTVVWISSTTLPDGNYRYNITVTTITKAEPIIGFVSIDSPSHPTVSIVAKDNKTEYEAGESLELTCLASGDPAMMSFRKWLHIAPDLWTHIQEYETDNTSDTIATLVLHDLTYRDSGVYVCVVCNGVENFETGATAARAEIYIVVKDHPIIKSHTNRTTGLMLSNVTLSIYFVSFDFNEPTVAWYKMIESITEEMIDDDKNGIRLSLMKLYVSLTFYNATIFLVGFRAALEVFIMDESWFTSYSIHIENSIGNVIDGIELSRKGPPNRPDAVQVTQVTDMSISLEWVPGFDGGSVQTFVLEDGFANEWISQAVESTVLQTASIRTTITDLVPETNYTLRVYAKNFYGVSEYSDVYNVTTLQNNSASGCQWQRQQLEADSPASSAVSLEIIIGGSIGAFIIGLILGATVIVVCHQRGDNPEHLKRTENQNNHSTYMDIERPSARVDSGMTNNVTN